jgi:hypothetical protein
VLKQVESVHDALTGRGGDVRILTSVMMHCGPQGIAMLAVGCPSVSLSWFLVCNDFASWRSKDCLAVIHEAVEVSSGGQLWMQSRGPQEIQDDFRLRSASVPQVHRKSVVY